MKEIIFIAIFYCLFLIGTIALFKKAKRMGNVKLIVSAIIYLIGIYFYYEMINQLHILLRDKHIYFEFGHASLMLIYALIISYLTAIIAIGLFITKNRKYH